MSLMLAAVLAVSACSSDPATPGGGDADAQGPSSGGGAAVTPGERTVAAEVADPAAPATRVSLRYVETRVGPEGPADRVVDVVADEQGSWAVTDDTGTATIHDEAAASISSSYAVGDRRQGRLETGLAVGAPDPSASLLIGNAALEAFVWALGADDPRIEVIDLHGRRGLRFETSLAVNEITGGPDAADIVVDAETGLPLRYSATSAGEIVETLRVEELVVAGDLDERVGPVPRPEAGLDTIDAGFRRMAVDDVDVGYPTLVPQFVPDGFVLDAVSVAPGRAPSATGEDRANPPSTDVVTLRYRNGWRTFSVSTRRVVDAAAVWVDPFRRDGDTGVVQPVDIVGGHFDGAHGELSVGPESVPHLWAIGNGLVVTVSGSVRADELIAVASSMQPA